MLAEWSAECSADDPILIVPWHDPSSGLAFVDLRASPYDLDSIPEADRHPPLMQALRALNSARSPVFTAKCDAWPLGPDELESLRLNLDLGPNDASAGFSSYIDLIARDRSLFASFPRQEQLLRRVTRLAAPLDHPSAALDCVLRPALLELEDTRQGYAVSLYVKALAADTRAAYRNWSAALHDVVALIRGNDLSR